MPTQPESRWRAALTMRLMTDALRQSTVAGIEKVAPQSALMANPAIAASYGALTTKAAKFAADLAAAAASEKVYLLALGTVGTSRGALDREIDTLKTLVENNALSAADLLGMGFSPLAAVTASHAMPDAPATPVVKPGHIPGKARVAVPGKGYIGHFAAQVSVDPYGPTTWEALPGNGKQRKLSGYPSGTKLWVRFAEVRFGMQSPWSTPVHVTIP